MSKYVCPNCKREVTDEADIKVHVIEFYEYISSQERKYKEIFSMQCCDECFKDKFKRIKNILKEQVIKK